MMWNPSLRALRWLLRFRHRCGYNIHSPFAFSLVTGVIYEREAYYAYSRLSPLTRRAPLRERDYRLLLRLANHSGARTALILSDGDEAAEAYLRAGRSTCRCYTAPEDLPAAEGIDLLYIRRGEQLAALLPLLPERLTERSLVIVGGIYHSPQAREAWRTLRRMERVRVTFDLYDFGLAYTEPRLNKEDYVINYF